jgi:hypothetical protein
VHCHVLTWTADAGHVNEHHIRFYMRIRWLNGVCGLHTLSPLYSTLTFDFIVNCKHVLNIIILVSIA